MKPILQHKPLDRVLVTTDLEKSGSQAGPVPPLLHEAKAVYMEALANGTIGGRPALMMRIVMDDGSHALAQIPLRILMQAAEAFRAHYGKLLD